jgi:dTDP-4-dehydrorhamnose reductase
MNIAVLGANGMLGHKMLQVLAAKHDVVGVVRHPNDALARMVRGRAAVLISSLDPVATLRGMSSNHHFDVVVNCVGLIKQRPDAESRLQAIEVNSSLPHRLSAWCAENDSRLVHVSTDCVFSGRLGAGNFDYKHLARLSQDDFERALWATRTKSGQRVFYSEESPTDAEDVYGKSKALGEVVSDRHAVTIRTSIIGRELSNHASLVDWFLRQTAARGFIDHYWSGVSTLHLAQFVRDHVLPDAELSGLHQLAMPPIHKARLLELIARAFRREVPIERVESGKPINRLLDGAPLDARTGRHAPRWEEMIDAMAEDARGDEYPEPAG